MHIKFIQEIIDKLRKKGSLNKKLSSSNNIQVPKTIIKKIKFNVKGKNNNILFKSKNINGNVVINIFGNNNTVILEENVFVSTNLEIVIGQNHPSFGEVTNSKFFIGKNSSIESLKYITFNSNSFCEIEEDCMFSYGITLYNTDAHPIFKKGTKELINQVKGIKVGKHSWIGMNVTILKNSIIPSNSIIGCNAVFSGKQTLPYCVFAGNPARMVKENVEWDGNGNIYGYIKNEF